MPGGTSGCVIETMAVGLAPGTCRCVSWLYFGDDGYYKPYDPETSSYIEVSYTTNKPKHQISTTEYEIDFKTMTQLRKGTG